METQDEHILMEAVLGLKFAQERTDQALAQVKAIAQPLRQKHNPRARFERWRDSVAGKHWKESQHISQHGRCNLCQGTIALNGSHLDHIKPLSRSPHLACEPRNRQILCTTCNQRKGDRSLF